MMKHPKAGNSGEPLIPVDLRGWGKEAHSRRVVIDDPPSRKELWPEVEACSHLEVQQENGHPDLTVTLLPELLLMGQSSHW